MSEWKKILLTDITTKIGDGLHGTPIYDSNGEYYFINGNNLVDGRILIKPETQKVSKAEFQKYEKLLNERTLLLGINGTIGNLAYYRNEKCMLGKSACFLNLNNEVDKRFVYYLFLNKDFQNYIVGIATGTTIPNVPLKGIREYSFKLPPLPEQTALAEVLSSLDDKIVLLHRQNKTLEHLAETLFRQWFVEGAEESWNETSLYEVFELVGGGTPKTDVAKYWDGNIKWISAKDVTPNHKSFITDTEKTISELGLQNSSTKILDKYSTVITARGTVGKYCLLSEPMAFSQSNYGINPKFKDCFFFTYLLIAYSVEELQAAAYGSIFDTITTNTFKEHKLKIPDKKEINNFENIISPYFVKMLSNTNQICTLTQLRDTLLPKLMSGEVRVKN